MVTRKPSEAPQLFSPETPAARNTRAWSKAARGSVRLTYSEPQLRVSVACGFDAGFQATPQKQTTHIFCEGVED